LRSWRPCRRPISSWSEPMEVRGTRGCASRRASRDMAAFMTNQPTPRGALLAITLATLSNMCVDTGSTSTAWGRGSAWTALKRACTCSMAWPRASRSSIDRPSRAAVARASAACMR
jgi:hypothetical protein